MIEDQANTSLKLDSKAFCSEGGGESRKNAVRIHILHIPKGAEADSVSHMTFPDFKLLLHLAAF